MKQSKPRHLPDFSKKVVSVTPAGDDCARVLVHPRWEMQAGRLFLIGAVVAGSPENEWCEGLENAVAWESITDYMVFDSPKDYARRLAIYRRNSRKS
jgi:hypothetical protein